MARLNVRSVIRLGAILVVAATAMSIFIGLLDTRDAALRSAQSYLHEAAQVHDAVGEIRSVSLHHRLYYQGIPGQEPPYREYSFWVSGARAKAFVVIRAEEEAGVGPVYRIVRLERRDHGSGNLGKSGPTA